MMKFRFQSTHCSWPWRVTELAEDAISYVDRLSSGVYRQVHNIKVSNSNVGFQRNSAIRAHNCCGGQNEMKWSTLFFVLGRGSVPLYSASIHLKHGQLFRGIICIAIYPTCRREDVLMRLIFTNMVFSCHLAHHTRISSC